MAHVCKPMLGCNKLILQRSCVALFQLLDSEAMRANLWFRLAAVIACERSFLSSCRPPSLPERSPLPELAFDLRRRAVEPEDHHIVAVIACALSFA